MDTIIFVRTGDPSTITSNPFSSKDKDDVEALVRQHFTRLGASRKGQVLYFDVASVELAATTTNVGNWIKAPNDMVETSTPDIEIRDALMEQVNPSGFGKTLTRIRTLLKVDEDDEEFVSPTSYAVKRALDLLYSTAEQLGNFPLASGGTDYKGGLHIMWSQGSRAVHVMLPPEEDGNSFIYFGEADRYDTTEVTADNLAERLRWMIRA